MSKMISISGCGSGDGRSTTIIDTFSVKATFVMMYISVYVNMRDGRGTDSSILKVLIETNQVEFTQQQTVGTKLKAATWKAMSTRVT